MEKELLVRAYLHVPTGSLLGMMAILFTAGRLRSFTLPALAMSLVFVVLGSPSVIRGLPGVSRDLFRRHLGSHLQFFYLIACVSAIPVVVTWIAGERPNVRQWAALAIVTLVAALFSQPLLETLLSRCRHPLDRSRRSPPAKPRRLTPFWQPDWHWLSSSPFALQTPYFSVRLQQTIPTQVAPLPLELDPATPLGQVQKLSRTENRRHFSATFLYPNWSSAFQILDLRLLEALYPKTYFALNGGDGLFADWERDSAHTIRPDRFVRPVHPSLLFGDEFQRLSSSIGSPFSASVSER